MGKEEWAEGTGLWLTIHLRGPSAPSLLFVPLPSSLCPLYRSQISEQVEPRQEPGASPTPK